MLSRDIFFNLKSDPFGKFNLYQRLLILFVGLITGRELPLQFKISKIYFHLKIKSVKTTLYPVKRAISPYFFLIMIPGLFGFQRNIYFCKFNLT